MGKLLTEFPTGSMQASVSKDGDESSILFHFYAGNSEQTDHLHPFSLKSLIFPTHHNTFLNVELYHRTKVWGQTN